MTGSTETTFSFETVALLIAASDVTFGNKHYKIMEDLHERIDKANKKSASSYEHMFRGVKKRAKEISELEGDANGSATSIKTPTSGKKTTAAKESSAKKRGRGKVIEEEKKEEGEKDGNGDGEDEYDTPSKRVKSAGEEFGEVGGDFFADAFID